MNHMENNKSQVKRTVLQAFPSECNDFSYLLWIQTYFWDRIMRPASLYIFQMCAIQIYLILWDTLVVWLLQRIKNAFFFV